MIGDTFKAVLDRGETPTSVTIGAIDTDGNRILYIECPQCGENLLNEWHLKDEDGHVYGSYICRKCKCKIFVDTKWR